MAKTRIVALPGDGVGPEVLGVSLRVLDAVAERHDLNLDVQTYQCGAQYYQAKGREWEEGAFEACQEADAVLLGAVGWPGVSLPSGDIAGAGVVFGLRFGLDLYANIRPCKLYPGVPHKVSGQFQQVWQPENVDMVILRENTEGSYTPTRGMLSRGGEDEVAIDTRIITRKGALRVHEKAFQMAEHRAAARAAAGLQREAKVTCVDKSNVRRGCQLFRACYNEVAARYPKVAKDYAYVDAFCLWLVRNPEWFDVAVAPNMLGDIVTDLAAALQGGLGMAASGNIGDKHAMFEPVHGSVPKHTGEDVVNPYAMIQATAMMLEHRAATGGHRFAQAAASIERALEDCVARQVFTYDLGGDQKCSAVGEAVVQAIRSQD